MPRKKSEKTQTSEQPPKLLALWSQVSGKSVDEILSEFNQVRGGDEK